MTAITLAEVDATHAEARTLMNELNTELAALSGDSGASSFDAAALAGGAFFVARNAAGQGLGCGAVRPLGAAHPGIAELKRMYAREGTRGVGAALLRALEQRAAVLGYRALWLETRRINERALAFYRRHGYVEIAPFGGYVGRADAICLGKELAASPPLRIRRVDAAEVALIAPLAELLVDVVGHGSSVGFLRPLEHVEAGDYWREVFARVAKGLWLWVAEDAAGRVVGTVQLDRAGKANGRHRAEVQKLIVHSAARGRGIARRLMDAVETAARGDGRTTLHLDTEAASPAEQVYQRLAWQRVGEIPRFAADTDGELHATALYYKLLDEPGAPCKPMRSSTSSTN